MYHFLSGYTAKVAGTEKGVSEPQATYLIALHKVDCWLLNTGWSGGKCGVGQRMPIRLTRALLRAALDGSLAKTNFRADPSFGLLAPQSAPGIDSDLLDPVKTWASKEEFAETAKKFVGMFRKNFVKFEPFVDRHVLEAQPSVILTA